MKILDMIDLIDSLKRLEKNLDTVNVWCTNASNSVDSWKKGAIIEKPQSEFGVEKQVIDALKILEDHLNLNDTILNVFKKSQTIVSTYLKLVESADIEKIRVTAIQEDDTCLISNRLVGEVCRKKQ